LRPRTGAAATWSRSVSLRPIQSVRFLLTVSLQVRIQ
jgi:hypothetical protein